MNTHIPKQQHQAPPPSSDTGIVHALTGSLPCISCGYDLKGLTVKGICPECSTAVRATILARVDPGADALKPIKHKQLLALGLRITFTAALIAVASSWAMKAQETWPLLSNPNAATESAANSLWSLLHRASIALAALTAITIAIPVPGIKAAKSITAALGVLTAYPVALYAIHQIHLADLNKLAAYTARDADPHRITWHLLATAALAICILTTRPVIRDLVERCRAIRVGRVDRQHLVVLVSILIFTAVGSLIRLASTNGGVFEILDPIGSIVIFIASILLTLTLTRATVDAWRVAYAIDHPPLNLKDIFTTPTATSADQPSPSSST